MFKKWYIFLMSNLDLNFYIQKRNGFNFWLQFFMFIKNEQKTVRAKVKYEETSVKKLKQ